MTPSTHQFGAVVLAAGMSQRMGSPKALLDIDGKPLIQRLIDTIGQIGQIRPIIIVTGHEPEPIRSAVTTAGLRFVHNGDYEAGGMLSSVKVGAAAISGRCDAFFLMLLDQPLILQPTLEALMHQWRQRRADIVVPQHHQKHGHPILLAGSCCATISSLPTDATLRDFVTQRRHSVDVVEVNDPGVLSGVDTPQDYQIVLSMWRTNSCPTVPPNPA